MNQPPAPPPDRALTIWCNFKLTTDLADRLVARSQPHRIVWGGRAHASNLVPGASDAQCRSADVAFGQPAPEDVLASTSLRWVHLTSAGYTRFDRDDLRQALASRQGALTNSSQVYANPCAQHVLAMMLGHNRCLNEALRRQITAAEWAYETLRPAVRVLDGQSALIVGFGSIGRRLVELLRPYDMRLAAVRRRPTGSEPVPTYPSTELDALLPEYEHVVNLLPSAPGNRGFFNADRFARMKPSAAFYNVGRGDTVHQTELIEALRSGRPAAAYLDVTTPEPLPPDDPLWAAPNCWITPHIAGGVQDEPHRLVEHFLANLDHYTKGAKLIDRVM